MVAAIAVREVAELGFRPLRVSFDAAGQRLSPDGDSTRGPAFALVLDDPAVVPELRKIAAFDGVPLLLVTDVTRLSDVVVHAEVDELLVRPYGRDELRVRVARARGGAGGATADDTLRVGGLVIDLATYQVTRDGELIAFTFMEYELLRFLATHPGRVFTREALLSKVWGYDYYGVARTVDVHVRRVRATLGPAVAERIVTVRSVGYRFEGKEAALPQPAEATAPGPVVDLFGAGDRMTASARRRLPAA
ncbi:MAG: response regulator with CheY-like receiver domain and winged-helix DNA-binding domain [Solirubrobacterales bacterium]|nr:response regulator with CheY-like receiver domain and winged-helix DNA-binding domain [Solirubrobacterales bacterium]